MTASGNGTPAERCRVLIAGGGIAGLEALLALDELASDRVEITLLSPEPEFVYRPEIVEEPFSLEPAERHDLALIARDKGASFVLAGLAAIEPGAHRATLTDGSEVEYDIAIVCVGAKSRPAFESATTLRSWAEPVAIDEALDAAAKHDSRTIAFVVPPGVTWSLPLYELALLAQRRAVERGLEIETAIFTPERLPLAVFGQVAAQSVAEVLHARGIEVRTRATVSEEAGCCTIHPGGEALDAGAVVALPLLSGPAIEGLPANDEGFIPIDQYAEVVGAPDVFAAGDGVAFPIKQGGLGTQQADAAAEMIAARAGAAIDPQPFRPVLRGKLLTGAHSLHLASEVAGGGGEGQASSDYLWWPPKKVGGRYLAPFLAGTTATFEPGPPGRALDVEVSLPAEWHAQPMALDPLEPIDGD